MRISFISKVKRLHKAVTVANNTNLCSTILVVFLEFTSVDRANFPYEHTTEFVPVTGLECSYGKIFIPVTEISVTGPARPLIGTHRYFYKEKSGEARYEPARLTGLI